MKQKIVAPYSPILDESTRSVGYTFEAALADIINNFIGTSAKEVHVNFHSLPHLYAAVCNDGLGMTDFDLDAAMRYGNVTEIIKAPHWPIYSDVDRSRLFRIPKTNIPFWEKKIHRTQSRDTATISELEKPVGMLMFSGNVSSSLLLIQRCLSWNPN